MAKELTTINFIGAGKLGKTFAALIFKNKLGLIQGICNHTLISSHKACDFIGQGKPFASILELPPADITFITTADDAIATSSHQLSQSANLKTGSVVLHCSGSLSSELLKSVKAKGCFTASVHPMFSFADPAIAVLQYKNVYCAMEGDAIALTTLKAIFHGIGSICYTLNSSKKAAYHAAAAFVCQHPIILANIAMNLLQQAEINDDVALHLVINLLESTIANLKKTGNLQKSLTGPFQRGDITPIKKHLECLSHDHNLLKLYQLLGLKTLELSDLSLEKKTKLAELLSSDH